MTKLLYAASAAAILTVAGHVPAMAQSSASGMSTPHDHLPRHHARWIATWHAASCSMSAASRLLRARTRPPASGTMDRSGSSGSPAPRVRPRLTPVLRLLGNRFVGLDGTSGSSGSTTADSGTASSALRQRHRHDRFHLVGRRHGGLVRHVRRIGFRHIGRQQRRFERGHGPASGLLQRRYRQGHVGMPELARQAALGVVGMGASDRRSSSLS